MNYSLGELRALLERLDVRPSKRRGQNFLIDRGSLQKVVQFAAVSPEDDVLEIGPGLGALSDELARAARSYTAVEIEERFAIYLREILPDTATVLCCDVREVNFDTDLPTSRGLHLVSNVPYSLSSEVTLWAIRNRTRFPKASLLFQREFAERLGASPGGKEYGSLSVLLRLYADAELGPRVSGSCFFPTAEVESRLIRFRFLPEPREDVGDEALFEEIVRAAFATRRKTLLNALSASRFFETKEETGDALREVGIDPGRRAESLELAEYARLSRHVTGRGK